MGSGESETEPGEARCQLRARGERVPRPARALRVRSRTQRPRGSVDHLGRGQTRRDAGRLPHFPGGGRTDRLGANHYVATSDKGGTQTVRATTTMKKQYDFSKGERGKFYKPNLRLNIPVYLEPKLQKSIEEIARRKGQEVGAVVSRIVR